MSTILEELAVTKELKRAPNSTEGVANANDITGGFPIVADLGDLDPDLLVVGQRAVLLGVAPAPDRIMRLASDAPITWVEDQVVLEYNGFSGPGSFPDPDDFDGRFGLNVAVDPPVLYLASGGDWIVAGGSGGTPPGTDVQPAAAAAVSGSATVPQGEGHQHEGRIKFDLLAALKASGAAPNATTAVVDLSGHSVHGAGFSSLFWKPTSTTAPDGGTIIAINGVAVGRYKVPEQGSWDTRIWGAIQDGESHPLSQRYADLTAANAAFPLLAGFNLQLTDEIDWCAAQSAVLAIERQFPEVTPPNGLINCGGNVDIFGIAVHNRELSLREGHRFGVVIRGMGNNKGSNGSVLRSCGGMILYTGDGGPNKRYINAQSTAYIGFDGITIWSTNPLFKGKGTRLIDFSWGPEISDSVGMWFRNSAFSADPRVFLNSGEGPEALVSLWQAIDGIFDNCSFGQAVSAIRCSEYHAGNQAYSINHTVFCCTFNYEKYPIVNPGETFNFLFNNVEGLGGTTQAMFYDDVPWTEARPEILFTFDKAAGTLQRSDGVAWSTLGVTPLMEPFCFDPDGVNTMNLPPILSVVGDTITFKLNIAPYFGVAPFSDEVSNSAAIQAIGVSQAAGSGIFLKAQEKVTLTFHLDHVTRDNGRWDGEGGDNWEVNFFPLFVGTASNNVAPGAVSAVSLDGKTITFAGHVFVDEVSTTARLELAEIGAGPHLVMGCWNGDQFRPGSTWFHYRRAVNCFHSTANLYVGTARLAIFQRGGNAIKFDAADHVVVIQPPIYHDPTTSPGMSGFTYLAQGVTEVDPFEGLAMAFDYEIMPAGAQGIGRIDKRPAKYRIQMFTSPLNVQRSDAVMSGGGGFDSCALGLTQGSNSLGFGCDLNFGYIQTFGGALFLQPLGGLAQIGRESTRIGVGRLPNALANPVGSALEAAGDIEAWESATDLPGTVGLIQHSPDGTRWRQTIDNAGATTWTAIP